jgi:fructose-1,6-bisphosphatase I
MVHRILIVLLRKNTNFKGFEWIVSFRIGSIFGIWKKPDNVEKPIDAILQSGEHLRCSGYAVYGSACMFVLATPEGVNGFTLDPVINECLMIV